MNTIRLDLLKEEIEQIKDITIRSIVVNFLVDKVPNYFWSIPASSSGKYHPSFDQGKLGLIRHTKMVCAVACELLNLQENSEIDRDVVIAACILHDTFKQGYDAYQHSHTLEAHPVIAATEFDAFADSSQLSSEQQNKIDLIYNTIICHMGQWYDYIPVTPTEKLVHLADYIASRKFFDMFRVD